MASKIFFVMKKKTLRIWQKINDFVKLNNIIFFLFSTMYNLDFLVMRIK